MCFKRAVSLGLWLFSVYSNPATCTVVGIHLKMTVMSTFSFKAVGFNTLCSLSEFTKIYVVNFLTVSVYDIASASSAVASSCSELRFTINESANQPDPKS